MLKYDESSIKELEPLEAIRKVPGMYIGRTNSDGVFHLANEVIANSVDEFKAQRCSKINIIIEKINDHFDKIIISDDGPGIPLGKITSVVTKTHAGGKFDDKAYKYSGGLHGVGLTATNALSKYFKVTVVRDGKKVTEIFENGGQATSKGESYCKEPTGTKIEFICDEEIFSDTVIDFEKIDHHLYNLSSINSGLTIRLQYHSELPRTYFQSGGLEGFMKRFLKDNKIRSILTKPIIIYKIDDDAGLRASIALTFSNNVQGEMLKGFVNGLETTNPASDQIVGARMGISNSLLRKINSSGNIPKNLSITGADIREVLVGLVVVEHSNPLFESQTKEKLNSIVMRNFILSSISSTVSSWCETNTEDFNKVMKLVIQLAKAKAAAKKASDSIMSKNSASKKDILKNIDMSKFNDCLNNNPLENELFITEGNSAGGNAAPVRLKNQAIFRLRGKPANVFKSTLSKELEMIIDILGCGFGKKKDISKLRYHKIIGLVDADNDGAHIKALLLGFFFRFYPELIENGNIYVAEPPLYRMSIKNKGFYIYNMEHYAKTVEVIALEMFHLVNIKGKKLPDKIFQGYLRKIQGYKEFLDNHSNQFGIDPNLLERVIIHFDDVLKGNDKGLIDIGYTCKIKNKSKNNIEIEFDKDFNHYYLNIDNKFFFNNYKPIYQYLCDICISKVYLKPKNKNILYGPTTYDICRIIDEIFNNNFVKTSRYKGLGQMNPDQLFETALNPETRNITQITMADKVHSSMQFDIYLGKNIEERKRLFNND